MAQLLNDSIPFALLVLAVGFVFLIKGADFFVEGSSSVAKKLRIPSIIIGMTIVAMGTSLPETAVSITASIANSNSLAISNVTGSNIFNLMAVIGTCAILTPVAVQPYVTKRDFPWSIVAAIVLLAVSFFGNVINRIDGIILLVLFVAFIALMISSAQKARKAGLAETNEAILAAEEAKILPLYKCLIFIVGGVAAIIIGGDFVVDSACALALRFGLSETLVGLTIVAIGTSLPELVTSIVAAKKNEVDIALGNALGSNVFNIFFVLGIAGTISPVNVIQNNLLDLVVLIVFSVIVWSLASIKKELKRPVGILMVLLYLAYMAYIVIRDM